MAVALEQFVKNLTDSGVLSAGKLEHFLPPKAHPKDAQELARQLVQSKHLTKYQAQEIYQGRAKSLILGSYTILDRIGAGGMGQVFKAQHRRMDRIVAIKMLPKNVMRDAATVARFEREVRAAAKLEHANIVTAYDADEAGGVHFLVMQYVEGSDLSALVKKDGPISVAKATNYILQAARGLEYAHKHGVIHRDIKPANLLVNSEGTVKILDMGLARISSDGDSATQAELTGTGAVMGTIDYMAPEQALSTKHADARADIYSLGCSLYYLLTGRPIYEGETLTAKLIAHQSQAVPELRAILAETPAELDAVFQKMAAKKIAERYQTMSEVVADLESCSVALPTSSVVRPPVAKKTGSDTATLLSSVTSVIAPSTDPKSAEKAQPSALGKWGRKKRILMVSGGVGALVVVLALILAIGRGSADHDGDKSAQSVAVNQVEPPGPPGSAVAPFDAKQARAHQEAWAKYLGAQVETINSIGMKMVLIPPGEFLMGSTAEQVEAAIKKAIERGDEEPAPDDLRFTEPPQHKVVLTKPLSMSATEVTIGQFRQFIEATKYATLADTLGGESPSTDANSPGNKDRTWRAPGYAVSDSSPVTQVSWTDAIAFCNWLCQQEKLQPSYRLDTHDGWILLPGATGYRLPSADEWEYACRAGTTTQYSFGDDPAELDKYGWYKQNSGGGARDVGLKLPNPFGLYDMQGNAEEWCADWFDKNWRASSPASSAQGARAGAYRGLRGGNWQNYACRCRSAFRLGNLVPTYRSYHIGFRVVRTLETAAAASVPQVEVIEPAPLVEPAAATDAPPPAKAPFDAKQARAHQEAWAKHLGTQVETTNSIGMKMVLIPPGEFMMGSTDEQVEAAIVKSRERGEEEWLASRIRDAERPQHKVEITKPFAIVATEITVGQFRQFIGATKYVTLADTLGGNSFSTDENSPGEKDRTWRAPGYAVTDESPVTQVAWTDLPPFCNWLCEQEKLPLSYRQDSQNGWVLLPAAIGYRLPTEAEWEYACRAGTTTQYSFGDDPAKLAEYGWYNQDSGGARGVGLKPPNPFGLSDMHGNVEEWCADWLDDNWYATSPASNPRGPGIGTRRVIRGGNWNYVASLCRCANRLGNHHGPSYRSLNIGFRVVRRLSDSAERAPVSQVEPKNSAPPLERPGATKPRSTRVVPKPTTAPFDAKQARAYQNAWAKFLGTEVESTNSLGMKMVLLPPGKFMMGSTDEQVEAAIKKLAESGDGDWLRQSVRTAERPQHKVVLTKPIAMSSTEITIGQFRKFIDATKYVTLADTLGGNSFSIDEKNPGEKDRTWRAPGYAVTDELPVTQVAWTDVPPFCNWLCEQEKLSRSYRQDSQNGWVLLPATIGYRLPTEAEWEYACRAGTTTQYSFGDDPAALAEYAWYVQNSGGSARAVGLKQANPFGLYDMHGNVEEWCADWLEDHWYTSTPTDDPKGPPAGFGRVIRGGDWYNPASLCRCAVRRKVDSPALRLNHVGFRVVRTLLPKNSGEGSDVAGATTGSLPTTGSAPIPATAKLPPGEKPPFFMSAEYPAWEKQVHSLPAEDRVKQVIMKLRELNPGFDGAETHNVVRSNVTELQFVTDEVTDISPVRALKRLTSFSCSGSLSTHKGKLADLSPLQGMALKEIDCQSTKVADLSPLRGMRLTALDCSWTGVADLSPLEFMPLTRLHFGGTRVPNLAPLRRMALEDVNCSDTRVSDLGPLQGMPLKYLDCRSPHVFDLSPLEGVRPAMIVFTPRNIKVGIDTIRRMNSLEKIGIGFEAKDQYAPAEFWRKYDAGEFGKPSQASTTPSGQTGAPAPSGKITTFATPEFTQWAQETTALPPEQQVAAVVKKLRELNPDYDGNETHGFAAGQVSELRIVTTAVSDLSPVRALRGLRLLDCHPPDPFHRGRLSDLSPLAGLQLVTLHCWTNPVHDLSPLRGMKLQELNCGGTAVADLAPLAGMPLERLYLGGAGELRDLTALRGMKLEHLYCYQTQVEYLSVVAGMPLKQLFCYETPIHDLTPLAGMSLEQLLFSPAKITAGIGAVRQMTSLTRLGTNYPENLSPTDFWAKYDAGAFGKPR